MIYNSTVNDGQLNIGTPSVPKWIGVKNEEKPKLTSVVLGNSFSTSSTNNEVVAGMTMLTETGTYLVSFNGQHTGFAAQAFSSDQGVFDLEDIYQDLMAFPGSPHAVTFGSGEVLSPGVYDVAGAPSIAGTLTLDGGGDSASVFIIRGSGAFSAGANTTVILQGDAEARNIFWVSAAAMTIEANSIMKGTLVSRAGAINVAANTSLKGRMFSKTGALGIGANSILTAPSGDSPIDLGVLSSFVMFSTNGAITSDATSTITGDVGNGLGALTIAGTHYGEQFSAGTESIIGTEATTYSIYQNGTEVVNSSRIINSLKEVVSLQTMVTILTAGEVIEVRWKVDAGTATLDNRTLSLIRFSD